MKAIKIHYQLNFKYKDLSGFFWIDNTQPTPIHFLVDDFYTLKASIARTRVCFKSAIGLG